MTIDLNGKKVLIVRLSALGDVIRTIPAVLGLMREFPLASFTWLVENNSAGLLREIEGLKLIEIDRKRLKGSSFLPRLAYFRALGRDIRSRRFDVSIDFHGVLKSGLLPRLAGIRERIGYEKGGSKEGNRWLINRRLALADPSISRYERNLELARFIAPNTRPMALPLPPRGSQNPDVAAIMASHPILLFPGTSAHGRNKRWPAANWAALYRRLTAASQPACFVFGPDDGAYLDALSQDLGADLPRLPNLSLPNLGLALAQARLLVACDSAPLHLASLLKVPLVALMGPSDPVLNQPQPGKRRMVLPEVPCAPCRNRQCPILICQDMITPRRVADSIADLLREIESEEAESR